MDLKELKAILQILEEKQIAEFELEEEGRKLRIRKAAAMPAPVVPIVAPVVPSVAAAPAPPGGSVAALSPEATIAAALPLSVPAAADAGLQIVKSPIVGTFYRSPDPNSPPFIDVGDRVKVGQVLCIIEAMKLMNEIESEIAGEIVKIHAESGKPVQYGDPLFSIRA